MNIGKGMGSTMRTTLRSEGMGRSLGGYGPVRQRGQGLSGDASAYSGAGSSDYGLDYELPAGATYVAKTQPAAVSASQPADEGWSGADYGSLFGGIGSGAGALMTGAAGILGLFMNGQSSAPVVPAATAASTGAATQAAVASSQSALQQQIASAQNTALAQQAAAYIQQGNYQAAQAILTANPSVQQEVALIQQRGASAPATDYTKPALIGGAAIVILGGIALLARRA